MKRCSKCVQVKSTSEFYRLTSAKDGFSWHCKVCMRASRKKENRRATLAPQKTPGKPSSQLTVLQDGFARLYDVAKAKGVVSSAKEFVTQLGGHTFWRVAREIWGEHR